MGARRARQNARAHEITETRHAHPHALERLVTVLQIEETESVMYIAEKWCVVSDGVAKVRSWRVSGSARTAQNSAFNALAAEVRRLLEHQIVRERDASVDAWPNKNTGLGVGIVEA